MSLTQSLPHFFAVLSLGSTSGAARALSLLAEIEREALLATKIDVAPLCLHATSVRGAEQRFELHRQALHDDEAALERAAMS